MIQAGLLLIGTAVIIAGLTWAWAILDYIQAKVAQRNSDYFD